VGVRVGVKVRVRVSERTHLGRGPEHAGAPAWLG
jgi:hypothetical protein